MREALFRFVVLHHTDWISHPKGDHWDWMLEPPERPEEGLITFAGRRTPLAGWSGELLEALPRHRMAYLEYEGPISGNRGSVKRVASGILRWICQSPERLVFDLVEMDFSEPPFTPWLTGRYFLTPHPPSTSGMWRLEFATGPNDAMGPKDAMAPKDGTGPR